MLIIILIFLTQKQIMKLLQKFHLLLFLKKKKMKLKNLKSFLLQKKYLNFQEVKMLYVHILQNQLNILLQHKKMEYKEKFMFLLLLIKMVVYQMLKQLEMLILLLIKKHLELLIVYQNGNLVSKEVNQSEQHILYQ